MFFRRRNKEEVKSIRMLVSIMSDQMLFDEWCRLDMINSGEDATKYTVFDYIAVEDELVRRGYGNSEGKIIPSEIDGFYIRKKEEIYVSDMDYHYNSGVNLGV